VGLGFCDVPAPTIKMCGGLLGVRAMVESRGFGKTVHARNGVQDGEK
jgi:hypothetical protein